MARQSVRNFTTTVTQTVPESTATAPFEDEIVPAPQTEVVAVSATETAVPTVEQVAALLASLSPDERETIRLQVAALGVQPVEPTGVKFNPDGSLTAQIVINIDAANYLKSLAETCNEPLDEFVQAMVSNALDRSLYAGARGM